MSISFGLGLAPVYLTMPVTVPAVAGSTVKIGAAAVGEDDAVVAELAVLSAGFDLHPAISEVTRSREAVGRNSEVSFTKVRSP
jgi:hypothetical protein